MRYVGAVRIRETVGAFSMLQAQSGRVTVAVDPKECSDLFGTLFLTR